MIFVLRYGFCVIQFLFLFIFRMCFAAILAPVAVVSAPAVVAPAIPQSNNTNLLLKLAEQHKSFGGVLEALAGTCTMPPVATPLEKVIQPSPSPSSCSADQGGWHPPSDRQPVYPGIRKNPPSGEVIVVCFSVVVVFLFGENWDCCVGY